MALTPFSVSAWAALPLTSNRTTSLPLRCVLSAPGRAGSRQSTTLDPGQPRDYLVGIGLAYFFGRVDEDGSFAPGRS
jgi:hypothetical protein